MVTRTRTIRGQPQTLSTTRQFWQTGGSSSGSARTSQGSDSVSTYDKFMTDELTPGFFRLKASNAILPTNAMQKSETRLTFKPGETISVDTMFPPYVSYYRMAGSGIVLNTAWGRKIPSVLPTIPISVPSEAECNSVAINAVANARQKLFDGLTFLAELEKTTLLFKEVISRYTERCLVVDKHARVTYKTLKRGSVAARSGLTFASVFSNTWMEYRYGWTPLSFEIKALYAQILELERMFHRVKGKASSDTETIDEVVTMTAGQGIWVGGSYISGGEYWRCETSRGVEYTITSSALIELSTLFRVTTDPLLAGFELIPYSWMADWILNIGNLIRAFSPFALGDLKSCCVVVKKTAYVRSTMVVPNYGNRYWGCQTHTPAFGAVEFQQTQRLPWSPSFALDFRLELNLYRILDLVALSMKKLSKTLGFLPDDQNRYKLGTLTSAFFRNTNFN